ncbi:MAG: glycosyltransferase family 4 protein [bacterium]|nr:glycosyltransferase family 4 protein [bacterium]
MRLVLVNSAWPQGWGGGEKWTVETAAWLRDQGHDVHVVARPRSRLIAAARARKIPCTETIFGGDFDPLAIRRARRILRSTRAELAVVNFNKEAWHFGFAGKLLGVPVVARHGFPLFKRRSSHRFLARYLITRLVVNAASIRDGYSALGIATRSVDVILNGVQPVEPIRGELRRRYSIPEDAPLLVAAGRLESQKRFDRLIEIASRLRGDCPDLRVLIFGEGPLRSALEKHIADLALQKPLVLAGFVADLPHIICDADLFALTSDDEGSPNALLEAMAAGVDCVAFDVGSVADIFGSEFRANLISPEDIDAMAARLQLLLRDADRRSAEGNRMRERVRSHFSHEESMRQFEQLYLDIIARPS